MSEWQKTVSSFTECSKRSRRTNRSAGGIVAEKGDVAWDEILALVCSLSYGVRKALAVKILEDIKHSWDAISVGSAPLLTTFERDEKIFRRLSVWLGRNVEICRRFQELIYQPRSLKTAPIRVKWLGCVSEIDTLWGHSRNCARVIFKGEKSEADT